MLQIRQTFNKAANNYNNYAYLQKEIALRLDEKLDYIKINPIVVVDLGAGTGLLSTHLMSRFPSAHNIAVDFAQNSLKHNPIKNKICADAYQLPFANNSVDIVVSNLMMQWCFNLNALFEESYRVLKNNGLLLFSTFGVNTLTELKKSWAVVDENKHVNDFVDMHNIADEILKAGLQAPVMESEYLILTYESAKDLLKELKAIGAQNVKNRSKSLTGKNKFKEMIKTYENYRQDGKLPATYEVIYGHAWKVTNNSNIPLEQ